MKNQLAQKRFVVIMLVFASIVLTANVYAQNMFRKINDFDGDGRADYAVTRNENGSKVWYIWQTTAGFRAMQWGIDSDKIAAGDYDGDNKTDIAVVRPVIGTLSAGEFFVFQSSTNSFYYQISEYEVNTVAIEPVQQDYDGDGKTEIAVLYKRADGSGRVIFRETSNSANRRVYLPDANQSFLRLGDLTGGGTSDIIYHTSDNNRLNISNYPCCFVQNTFFGTAGDQYLAADFDGDGKGEIAVFRESDGTWWWIKSSDATIQAVQWGSAGDKPVPADYDGDGTTDLAIWRGGNYWILGSQNGVSVFNWGLSSDIPVRY